MLPLVLIVDDDAELSVMLVRLLQAEGWMAQTVRTAAAAELAIARRPPDVVLLDMMLPDANGLALCRRWRATQPAMGILMLTARGDPVDQMRGQALGADDVLPKPFEKRALVNRLRAVLRLRAPAAPLPTRQRSSGGLTIHLARREVLADGRVIPMTDIEFTLLLEMARRPGQTVSSERLSGALHAGGHAPLDGALDVQMDRLRQRLSSAAPDHVWIEAVRGQGFAFVPRMGSQIALQHDAADAV